MFRPEYPIRTERLVLRPFEPQDFDDLHAYRSSPEVCRYIYSESATPKATAARLEKSLAMGELTEEGDWLVLAVCLQDEVIGDVVLRWRSKANWQGEVGYVFNPDFTGRGYALEAARAMLKIGFEGMGLHRIVAECDARNEPSWRSMERLGMRREALLRHAEVFKGEWGDLLVCAMLAEEHRTTK
ncbi:GNAT family N-acetyltransferase [Lentzea sp. NBRC 102530]|uniref:GNAT family N-acetyltransferase n=1 Tax=Lentzea sp. NBRC 102530 TaxID=3032201 RepID=UPI0024A089F3|nr:GNAT family N-acetyltransferase [Lentzea sp. NBRC 102530]GLY52637.1 N-acetyltransferase [Lentzea sp. NBRC 102530]